MASRYTIDEALEAILDDDFGLSDGDSSDEEGEDIYCYVGEPVLRRADVDILGGSIADSLLVDREDDSEVSEENGRTISSDPLATEHEHSGDNQSSADESASHDFHDNGVASDSDTSSVGFSPCSPVSQVDDGSTYRRGSRGRGRGRTRGRGCARGRGHPRGRGRARGRGHAHGRGRTPSTSRGASSGTSSRHTDSVVGGLPVVDGTWEKREPTPTHYNFNEIPGPSSDIDRNSNPAQLFCRFFTDEVWDLLVEETNKYANANTSTAPHARPWNDTTVPEMKAFVGMLIIMGIVVLPRLELYWTTSHPLIAQSGIASVMARVRFEQLFRFLHLNDNNNQVPIGDPEYDRLFKVRKLLDLITPKFESEYVPHKQVSVDEAMIPFKGRLGFKQYMKDKPTKWGIKVFTLCDATNGYVYRLQVYTGKNLENSTTSVGLCSQVVLDLMAGFDKRGHELYTDNYHTSPQLFLSLHNKGINACGTVRSNRRYFPQDLVYKRKQHERGFYDYRSNGSLLAVVWMDKRYIP